jgi:hypothetical protein
MTAFERFGRRNVCFWHKADIATVLSTFDPFPTSSSRSILSW